MQFLKIAKVIVYGVFFWDFFPSLLAFFFTTNDAITAINKAGGYGAALVKASLVTLEI